MSNVSRRDESEWLGGDTGSSRSKGTKVVRLRLPDTSTPEFRAEAERQAAVLRGAPEEREALAFIEAVADWPDHDA